MPKHEVPSTYDNVAACLAEQYFDEHVALDPRLESFSEEQIEFIFEILKGGMQEALLDGVSLKCDHPDLTMDLSPEAMDFDMALEIANINGFHRGYYCRDLQSTNREER